MLSALHALRYWILSVTPGASAVIIIPILQTRRLGVREIYLSCSLHLIISGHHYFSPHIIALYVVSLRLTFFSLNLGLICKLYSKHDHWERAPTINNQYGYTGVHGRAVLPCWICPKWLWEPKVYLLQHFGQGPVVYRIRCRFLTLAFIEAPVIWSHCCFQSFSILTAALHSISAPTNLDYSLFCKYYFFCCFCRVCLHFFSGFPAVSFSLQASVSLCPAQISDTSYFLYGNVSHTHKCTLILTSLCWYEIDFTFST